MRTTLTLDDDVAAALRRYQEVRGETWRAPVNEILRVGLANQESAPPTVANTLTHPLDLGEFALSSLDDISEVLDLAEGSVRR